MTRKTLIIAALAAAALMVALVVTQEPVEEAPVRAPETTGADERSENGIRELELPTPDADEDWEKLLSGDDAGVPDISPDGFYQDMEESFQSIARPGEIERDKVTVKPTIVPLPEPVPDEENGGEDEENADP